MQICCQVSWERDLWKRTRGPGGKGGDCGPALSSLGLPSAGKPWKYWREPSEGIPGGPEAGAVDIGGIWNCSAWRRLGIEVFVPNIDLMIQRHIQTLLGRIRMGIHRSELQEGRFRLDMGKIFYTSSGEILGKKNPGKFSRISFPTLSSKILL